MALLRLNLGQQQRPSPTETTAERISRLLDAGIITGEPEKLLGFPWHATATTRSCAPAGSDLTAVTTVNEHQPTEPTRHKAAYWSASTEPRSQPPMTVADRLTRLLDTSAPGAHLKEPWVLTLQDAVTAAPSSPVEPHFAAPATTTVPEEPRPVTKHDVVPPPSGPPAEPHFAMVLDSIAPEQPRTLRRQDAVPAAPGRPAELHFAMVLASIAPEQPRRLRRQDALPVASSSPSVPHFTGPMGTVGTLPECDPLPTASAPPEGLQTLPVEHDPVETPAGSPPGAVFACASMSPGLFPARGFLYSLLAHGIAIVALLLPWPKSVSLYDPPKKFELTMIPKDALYLPALGGGAAGGPQRGGAAKSQTIPSLSVAALSKLGVSYPGGQAIVSNPPHPTNHVQTLLQPRLPHPPELTEFVHLPNVVRLAESTTTQTTSAPDSLEADPSIQAPLPPSGPVAPKIPPLRALGPALITAPKLSLPLAAPVSNLVKQATPLPQLTPGPPKPTQARVLPGSFRAKTHTLIALSMAPAPPDPAPKIPPAEAHGQFAVVALPHLAVSQLGIGAATESETPEAAGAGANPNSAAHNAAGAGTLAVGANARPAAGGRGTVASLGPGPADGGTGRNASGTAGGGMTIRGAAFGSGSGAGKASGVGAGAGPAPGAFAGLTIQGGEWPSGMPADVAPHLPAKPPESGGYGLTVVSTGNSGSGLGDLGVFSHEPVFTVYISMTTPSDGTAPSWTLVYAALHPSESGGEKITPPFPSKKETPAWPTDMVVRYRSQLVVVYMVIDESGKVQRARSVESPNADFVAPLLAALNDWEFRPATLNGKPVAVRGLLGVPISAQPVPTPTPEQ